jgi:hypothetical protein
MTLFLLAMNDEDSRANWLNLTRIELDAGRSSQSTLLGIDEKTIESLYLSRHLRNMVC